MRVLLAWFFLSLVWGRRVTVDLDEAFAEELEVEQQEQSSEEVLEAEEYGTKSRGLSIVEAEHIFNNWRQRLRSRHAAQAVSHAEAGRADQERGTPAKLFRAIARAALPIPAIAACLTLHLNLAQLGFADVKLSLGFRGEIAFNTCTECFTWNVQTDLGFQIGMKLPGIGGITAGYNFNGAMKLEELPCEQAADSSYCRFMHIFMPMETRRLKAATAKCNTDSPFEVLSAYTSYAFAEAERQFAEKKEGQKQALEQVTKQYDNLLRGYLTYFKDVQALTEPQVQSKNIPVLAATCRWAHVLAKSMILADTPDLFCQIEVAIAGLQYPNHVDKCSYSQKEGRCIPDAFRCLSVFSAPPTCKDTSRYDGDIWRSSIQPNNHRPNWNEGHGFYVLGSEPQEVHVRVTVTDWNDVSYHEVIGFANTKFPGTSKPSALVKAGYAYRSVDRSLTRSPYVITDNRTEDPEEPAMLCPGNPNNPQSALEFWISCSETDEVQFQVEIEKDKQIAKYMLTLQIDGPVKMVTWKATSKPELVRLRAGQHSLRLISFLEDGSGGSLKTCPRIISLSTTSEKCKFPARHVLPLMDGKTHKGLVAVDLEWLPDEKKGAPVDGLRVPLNAMSAAVESFVGKLPDYANQVFKRLQTPRGQENDIEADIDYENHDGKFMARYKNARVRGELSGSGLTTVQQDLPTPPEKCQYDKKTKQCNNLIYCKWQNMLSWTCVKNFDPIIPCTRKCRQSEKICKKCEDNELCYNERKKECTAHTYDCRHGNSEQNQNCRNKESTEIVKAARVNQNRGWDPMRDLQNAYGHLDEVGKKMAYQVQGVPCAKMPQDADVDERVVDFDRILTQHKQKDSIIKEFDFYAEFATSAANLFVRTVADLQAVFNLYFTGEPEWDGSCLTARPHSQIPDEFAQAPRKRQFHTQTDPSPDWITHTVKWNTKLGEEGAPIRNYKHNPWCQREWASESRLQAERQAFAHRDPPRGLTGLRADPRELDGTMFSQFWCEALEKYSSTDAGQERLTFNDNTDLKVKKFVASQGWDLNFRSTCSQLNFEEVQEVRLEDLDAKTKERKAPKRPEEEEPDGHFTVWRRYDCEKVLLTPQFMVFFPSLIADVFAFRREIGIILENVLQCAGRINEREFETENSEFYKVLEQNCEVSVGQLLKRNAHPTSKRNKWRLNHIEVWASDIVKTLQRWLRTVEHKERDLIADFQELWEHGEHLTGAVFKGKIRGKKIMDQVVAQFNTQPALTTRSGRMQDHLVMKAWMKQGQKGTLFPPPVRYAVTLTVPTLLPKIRSEEHDICKVSIPPSLSLGEIKFKDFGRTYRHQSVASRKKICYAGQIAPLSGIMFGLEACTATVMVEEEEKTETSYIISLRSVLHVGPIGGKPEKKSMTQAMTPDEFMNEDQIKDDEATSSVAWQMGKHLLTNAGNLLGGLSDGGIKEMAQQIYDMVSSLVGVIQEKVKTLSQKVLERLKSANFSEPAVEAVSLKEYRLLDIDLHFVKVGDEDWTPKFYVYYKRVWDASIDVSIPGVMSIKGSLQASQRYDLSSIFSEIYHAFMDHKSDSAYHRCLRCLDKPRFVYCHTRGSRSSGRRQSRSRSKSRSSSASALQIYANTSENYDDELEPPSRRSSSSGGSTQTSRQSRSQSTAGNSEGRPRRSSSSEGKADGLSRSRSSSRGSQESPASVDPDCKAFVAPHTGSPKQDAQQADILAEQTCSPAEPIKDPFDCHSVEEQAAVE